jgi:hypothetical protein
MPRGKPPKTDRPVRKELSLPSSIAVRVDLLLWSDVEQCVPHGAWSDHVTRLIEADLVERTQKRATVRSLAAAEKVMVEVCDDLAPINSPNFPLVAKAVGRLTAFIRNRQLPQEQHDKPTQS